MTGRCTDDDDDRTMTSSCVDRPSHSCSRPTNTTKQELQQEQEEQYNISRETDNRCMKRKEEINVSREKENFCENRRFRQPTTKREEQQVSNEVDKSFERVKFKPTKTMKEDNVSNEVDKSDDLLPGRNSSPLGKVSSSAHFLGTRKKVSVFGIESQPKNPTLESNFIDGAKNPQQNPSLTSIDPLIESFEIDSTKITKSSVDELYKGQDTLEDTDEGKIEEKVSSCINNETARNEKLCVQFEEFDPSQAKPIKPVYKNFTQLGIRCKKPFNSKFTFESKRKSPLGFDLMPSELNKNDLSDVTAKCQMHDSIEKNSCSSASNYKGKSTELVTTKLVRKNSNDSKFARIKLKTLQPSGTLMDIVTHSMNDSASIKHNIFKDVSSSLAVEDTVDIVAQDCSIDPGESDLSDRHDDAVPNSGMDPEITGNLEQTMNTNLETRSEKRYTETIKNVEGSVSDEKHVNFTKLLNKFEMPGQLMERRRSFKINSKDENEKTQETSKSSAIMNIEVKEPRKDNVGDINQVFESKEETMPSSDDKTQRKKIPVTGELTGTEVKEESQNNVLKGKVARMRSAFQQNVTEHKHPRRKTTELICTDSLKEKTNSNSFILDTGSKPEIVAKPEIIDSDDSSKKTILQRRQTTTSFDRIGTSVHKSFSVPNVFHGITNTNNNSPEERVIRSKIVHNLIIQSNAINNHKYKVLSLSATEDLDKTNMRSADSECDGGSEGGIGGGGEDEKGERSEKGEGGEGGGGGGEESPCRSFSKIEIVESLPKAKDVEYAKRTIDDNSSNILFEETKSRLLKTPPSVTDKEDERPDIPPKKTQSTREVRNIRPVLPPKIRNTKRSIEQNVTKTFTHDESGVNETENEQQNMSATFFRIENDKTNSSSDHSIKETLLGTEINQDIEVSDKNDNCCHFLSDITVESSSKKENCCNYEHFNSDKSAHYFNTSLSPEGKEGTTLLELKRRSDGCFLDSHDQVDSGIVLEDDPLDTTNNNSLNLENYVTASRNSTKISSLGFSSINKYDATDTDDQECCESTGNISLQKTDDNEPSNSIFCDSIEAINPVMKHLSSICDKISIISESLEVQLSNLNCTNHEAVSSDQPNFISATNFMLSDIGSDSAKSEKVRFISSFSPDCRNIKKTNDQVTLSGIQLQLHDSVKDAEITKENIRMDKTENYSCDYNDDEIGQHESRDLYIVDTEIIGSSSEGIGSLITDQTLFHDDLFLSSEITSSSDAVLISATHDEDKKDNKVKEDESDKENVSLFIEECEIFSHSELQSLNDSLHNINLEESFIKEKIRVNIGPDCIKESGLESSDDFGNSLREAMAPACLGSKATDSGTRLGEQTASLGSLATDSERQITPPPPPLPAKWRQSTNQSQSSNANLTNNACSLDNDDLLLTNISWDFDPGK